MNLHVCPYPGCDARISRDLFACRPHWYLLPGRLRSNIWRAYRGDNLAALVDAHEAAEQFYVEHEATRRLAAS